MLVSQENSTRKQTFPNFEQAWDFKWKFSSAHLSVVGGVARGDASPSCVSHQVQHLLSNHNHHHHTYRNYCNHFQNHKNCHHRNITSVNSPICLIRFLINWDGWCSSIRYERYVWWNGVGSDKMTKQKVAWRSSASLPCKRYLPLVSTRKLCRSHTQIPPLHED